MYRKIFKRLFDILLSVMIFPFWIIILIIVGPIIYFEDRGPIFYNAIRLGRDGKTFKMYKFRSMKMNAPDIRNKDGSTYNSENDPRLTRIGRIIRKTSIDETPQLINIIKGDMSIIGPRPDLPEHMTMYEDDEIRKLEIRPGITGYNQAYFRNTIPWKKRIQNDVYYIDHISLWFDMKIFFKTLVSVLKRQDVYIINEDIKNKSTPNNEI